MASVLPSPTAGSIRDWPWSTVLAALAADGGLRKTVESVMKDRGLSLDVYAMDVSYGQVAHVTLADSGFVCQQEDRPAVDQPRHELG